MSIELIDKNLCNGCRLCVDTCPQDVIRLDTLVADKNEYPPCRTACPAGVDIRSYTYLLRNDMPEEAINVLREYLPLPAVTGRICPHFCESECARKEVEESVNINALERYAADYSINEKSQSVRKIYASKIAVVGSGPAGLSCAYFLARMGYPVTIFESRAVLGGMLRTGIPDYRLPKNILDAQIEYIKGMGIEFKTGITINKDIKLKDIQNEYQAIFFAIGNQLSKKLELEGSNLDGVLWGLDFLSDINLKKEIKVKNKVVIIGGGNVAMDVAMVARRLGAKEVQVACLESADQMPAFKEQIDHAREEGILLHTSWGPKKILGEKGKVTGIEIVGCVSVLDEKGKFNPSFNEKTTKTLNADMVIFAIGQNPDSSRIPKEIKMTPLNSIQVDPITLQTNLEGIFAGGDIVSGTSVVEAIASGKRAADSIDRYCKGEDLKEGRYVKPDRVKNPPMSGIAQMRRQQTPLLALDQRAGNFKEVKAGLNNDTAILEAQRCMTCGSKAVITYVDDCQLCLFCERDCPQKAVYVSPERKQLPLIAWG